jgi:HEAT repeats
MRPSMGISVCFACTACLLARGASADVLRLKSGGEIRGALVAEVAAPGQKGGHKGTGLPEQVTIRTLDGALMTVARDAIEEVVRRRPVLEEYETLRRAAPDTVEGQWELAEWCRQKTLSKERAAHLERIVELDADHVAARRGLGHVRHEGRWATPDEIMTARGYVKHKGKYLLPQELELLEEEQRENEAEKAWFRKVRLWGGWLGGVQPDRQVEALQELRAIHDENAVPALARTFRDDPNEQKRLLYVEILIQIDTGKALNPLIQQSLQDDSELVRDAAVRGARRIDVTAALASYLRALKNETNLIVNRAATALGQLGEKSAIPRLIDALVTRHRYKVMVPDTSISMGSDGSMANGQVPLPPDVAAALATGQLPQGVQVQTVGVPKRMKRVVVQKDEQNPAVLSALSLLTGENFGYDEDNWRNWHKASQSGSLKTKKKPKAAPN